MPISQINSNSLASGVPTAAQGGSMVLIGSATASNSAQIDFTSISNSSYSGYRIYVNNFIPSNNGVNLLLRFSNSGTFLTSGYNWQNWRWTSSGSGVAGQNGGAGAGVCINANVDNMANAANLGGSFVIDIFDCAQTTSYTKVNVQGHYYGSAWLGIVGNGMSPNMNAIDGFRLLMDSGTISSGTVYLYGIKNA